MEESYFIFIPLGILKSFYIHAPTFRKRNNTNCQLGSAKTQSFIHSSDMEDESLKERLKKELDLLFTEDCIDDEDDKENSTKNYQSDHQKQLQQWYENAADPKTRKKCFGCTECGKTFYQLCDLQRHEIIHKNEKPYSCSKCGEGFNNAGNRSRHEKKLSCNYSRVSEKHTFQ